MPRRPHVKFRAGEKLLEDYFDELPVLRELDEQGRLVWYNAATSPPVGDSPKIGVRFFSSEAALNILGEMGVKKVRTLGIDGGTQYAGEFEDLPELQNGLPSFDAQFRELEDIVAQVGHRLRPADRADAGLLRARRVADRRRARARVLDPQAREPAGALLPDARRADARRRRTRRTAAARASRSAASTSRSCRATRAARSTSTRTCRCSPTSRSSGTSRSTARR